MDKVSLTSQDVGWDCAALSRPWLLAMRAQEKYTYANLMTQAGNKNCHPLWLFKTFTGATKKHSFDTRSN